MTCSRWPWSEPASIEQDFSESRSLRSFWSLKHIRSEERITAVPMSSSPTLFQRQKKSEDQQEKATELVFITVAQPIVQRTPETYDAIMRTDQAT